MSVFERAGSPGPFERKMASGERDLTSTEAVAGTITRRVPEIYNAFLHQNQKRPADGFHPAWKPVEGLSSCSKNALLPSASKTNDSEQVTLSHNPPDYAFAFLSF